MEMTFNYNENHKDNSICYCELCGKPQTEIEDKVNVTPQEVIWQIADMLLSNPIATELTLARVARPELSNLQIGKLLKRNKKAIVLNGRKATEENGGLGRMLCQTSPQTIGQRNRRKREKIEIEIAGIQSNKEYEDNPIGNLLRMFDKWLA